MCRQIMECRKDQVFFHSTSLGQGDMIKMRHYIWKWRKHMQEGTLLTVHIRGGKLSYYMAVTIQLWNEPTSGPQQFSSRFGKRHLLLGLQILPCKPHTTPCHSKNIENYNIQVPGACKHASEGTGILSLSLHESAIHELPFLKVGFMAAAELPESVKLWTGRDLRSNKKTLNNNNKRSKDPSLSHSWQMHLTLKDLQDFHSIPR